MKSWSRSLWAAGAQQASRCSFHSSAYRSQARWTVRQLDFSPKVDFQQRLYPQHYCPVHIGKAMFLSLPSENCADRCASHHVHRWSSHCAKPCGGQGQVPHSSGKVVGCNCCQTCSDEQRITASGARPRLTYQKNRRCVEEFRSTHDSPGAIENLNHWCYSWRCRSYILVEFLHKIIGCIVVHYSRNQHNLAKVLWKLDSEHVLIASKSTVSAVQREYKVLGCSERFKHGFIILSLIPVPNFGALDPSKNKYRYLELLDAEGDSSNFFPKGLWRNAQRENW